MRDGGVAHVAIDRERVLRRHKLRPVERLHRRVEIVGRLHRKFEDRPEYAHRRAQPKVGAIEQRQVAMKLHAAAAGFDVVAMQFAQLLRKDVLKTASTGCEEFQLVTQAPG